MVLDLVLVPERAEHVGGEDDEADQRDARRGGEHPQRTAPSSARSRTVGCRSSSDARRCAGWVNDGLQEAGRAAERDPPRVARRHTDQVAHHDEHREEHERRAMPTTVSSPILRSRFTATHTPSGISTSDASSLTSRASTTNTRYIRHLRLDRGVDGEAEERRDERIGMEVLAVRPADRRVEQVRRRPARARSPRCGAAVRASRNTGTAPMRDRERLEEEQHAGAREQPVERHEQARG